MKICPKCKAELDDNARFCLSCMTSLDEKTQIPQPARKRRLWPFVLAFASLVLCATLIWRLVPLTQPSMEVSEGTTANTQTSPSATKSGQPATTGATAGATAGTTAGTQPQQPAQSVVVAIPGPATRFPITQTTTPTESTAPADSSQPTQPEQPSEPSQATQPGSTPTETTAPPETTAPTETTAPPETTQPENPTPTVTVPVYTYRLASVDDIFVRDDYYRERISDYVVVTGISVQSSNGGYEIPPRITWTDGTEKDVVGIDDYALAGTNARVVLFDVSTRFGLGRYALSGCPLEAFVTDGGLYIDDTAFSGCPQGFTFYAEVTNRNQYGQYFRDCAGRYGAVWKTYDAFFTDDWASIL